MLRLGRNIQIGILVVFSAAGCGKDKSNNPAVNPASATSVAEETAEGSVVGKLSLTDANGLEWERTELALSRVGSRISGEFTKKVDQKILSSWRWSIEKNSEGAWLGVRESESKVELKVVAVKVRSFDGPEILFSKRLANGKTSEKRFKIASEQDGTIQLIAPGKVLKFDPRSDALHISQSDPVDAFIEFIPETYGHRVIWLLQYEFGGLIKLNETLSMHEIRQDPALAVMLFEEILRYPHHR